jgi:uncharacterized protein (TIGR00251 family)
VTIASARLRLRVAPGASTSQVIGRHGDAWRVRVAARPERGRANDELLQVVATAVGRPRSDVRLVSGASSRDKLVEVDGIDTAEAERRLTASADA